MNTLTKSSELRAALLESIAAVMEGRMNVSQANAVVGLSGELHKSIRQDWDMAVYAAENISYDQGRVINTVLDSGRLLEDGAREA